MKLSHRHFRKPTLLTVAAYFFMFAICTKGIYLYGSQHPSREDLIYVHGVVREVRLGGEGKATWLYIESKYGMHKYSSYYGKVWPGMDHIHPGDSVDILAERNRLNKNELIEGKQYYIWELLHRNQRIIQYDGVDALVQEKEAVVNRFINIWLIVGFIFLLIAWLRKIILKLANQN